MACRSRGVGAARASRATSCSRSPRGAGGSRTRCDSMPAAGPSCGCRRGSTATRRWRDRSAVWSWSIATRTNGAPRRSRLSRTWGPRGDSSPASPCATAGGSSWWRSPRSPGSGRGGGARDCPDAPVGAAGPRVGSWGGAGACRGGADPARSRLRRRGDRGHSRAGVARAGRRFSSRARARRDRRARRRCRARGSRCAGASAHAADRDARVRRQRRGQDDGRGEARRPAGARRALRAARGGGHVSRGCHRAAPDLGRPPARPRRHGHGRSRSRGVRRDRRGARPRRRHGARRYGRAAPYGRSLARGAQKGGPRGGEAAAGGAARVAARARRHGGAERRASGPGVCGGGAAHRARRDQGRRQREGRERGGPQARGPGSRPVSRDGRRPGRSRRVRRGTLRPPPGGGVVTLQLTTSVKYLKGVGPKRAEALARLGIRTVGDLLYHAPHRYLDATAVTPLARAHVGQDVTCVGRVASTGVLPTRKGLRVFRAVLRDDAGGVLECAWPGQPFLERQIKKGQLLLVTGPVRYYHGRQLVPREFVILADEGEAPQRGLVLPVYPATEGLTHRQIRGLIHQHLDTLLALVTDPHPKSLRAAAGLAELGTALAAVHRPATLAEAEAG